MFNCYCCGKSIGPNVKPLTIQKEEKRYVSYKNEYYVEDDYGNKRKVEVDSTGVEITGELQVCSPCGREYYDIPEVAQRKATAPRHTDEERLAPPLPLALFEVFFSNAMDRTLHKTKRAERDSLVAIPLVKEFVTLNPKFGKPA